MLLSRGILARFEVFINRCFQQKTSDRRSMLFDHHVIESIMFLRGDQPFTQHAVCRRHRNPVTHFTSILLVCHAVSSHQNDHGYNSRDYSTSCCSLHNPQMHIRRKRILLWPLTAISTCLGALSTRCDGIYRNRTVSACQSRSEQGTRHIDGNDSHHGSPEQHLPVESPFSCIQISLCCARHSTLC